MENIVFNLDELDRLQDDDPEAAKKRKEWQAYLVENRKLLHPLSINMHRIINWAFKTNDQDLLAEIRKRQK